MPRAGERGEVPVFIPQSLRPGQTTFPAVRGRYDMRAPIAALAAICIVVALPAAAQQPQGGPPERFARFLVEEVERWSRVVKAANVKAE